MHTDTRQPVRQGGAALFAVLLVLLTVATVVVATWLLESATKSAARTGTSQLAQFADIENALAAYVAVNKRLPCPADGSLASADPNRGKELRDGSGMCTGAGGTANQQTGIVPWATLGIPESVATSADLTMFSYRVFSGPRGLTQDNGADMSACDTDNTPNADAAIATTGLCDPTSHDNTPTQFLQGKGLTVDKDGTVLAGIAYALIHHGANGLGAFLPTGLRNALPAATNAREFANIQGTDPTSYTATYDASTPNLLSNPHDDNYFDDRVAYLTIQDLAKKAGLSPRNWPDNYLNPSRTTDMTSPSTDPNNPHFMSSGSGDTAFGAATTGGDTVVFFGMGTHRYAGCLWWPNPVSLYNGTDRYRWSLYAEASMADYPGDIAQGFTFGLLPASGGQPTNSTCGDSTSGQLGWGGGTLATGYLNRVAVEVDTHYDAAANDPANTHLAIDYGNTVHGVSAESCAAAAYGAGCDSAGSNTFLTDGGLMAYHSLRLDVTKGCTLPTTATGTAATATISVTDQTDIGVGMAVSGTGIASGATVTGVSGGTVTLSLQNTGNVSGDVTFVSQDRVMLNAWVLSNVGCAANPTACEAMKNIDAAFSTDLSAETEALYVKRCLALPTPTTDLDTFYFGITTANIDATNAASVNLTFRRINTSLVHLP